MASEILAVRGISKSYSPRRWWGGAGCDETGALFLMVSHSAAVLPCEFRGVGLLAYPCRTRRPRSKRRPGGLRYQLAAMSDQVLRLDGGRIVEQGTAREVLRGGV